MILRESLIITLTALLVTILLTSFSLAQDSLLINYQGRLTDNSGNPVTGSYDIAFGIYAMPTGPSLLWSETHTDISVLDGLFSVLLGSRSVLPDTVFTGHERYLGIAVGADTEVLPRTLLTSSPRAAVASKLIGDVHTSDGAMFLKTAFGDTSIVLSRAPDRASIRLFDPRPDHPGKSVLELASNIASGGSLVLFDPQPEPPGKTLELLGGFNSGAMIKMFDPQPEPPGYPRLEISSSPTLGAGIKMFDPQPEPPGKLFEIEATAGSGPSMGFFDQAGQVMGVEPSPFNSGFSLVMFDPQPEPPGKLFEIATTYARAKSVGLKMFSVPDGAVRQEIIAMSGTGSAAELRMGTGAPAGGTESLALIRSDESSSRIEITGPAGGPWASPPVVMISNSSGAMVGIGTSSPSQALEVIGSICYTGSIGTCSDSRYKENVAPITGAVDKVNRLRGVRFHWRKDEFPEKEFSDGDQIGLIAQELNEVLPQVVSEDGNGYYNVDYSKLTPVLVEAIKEQQEQIIRQQVQIKELMKRIQVLEESKFSSR